MFEAKDIINDAVRNTLAILAKHVRGDVVAWNRIEEAAGFTRFSPHWTQFQKRLRRDFLHGTGILLWPVNGTGLELVRKEDQLGRCHIARQRRAIRQLSRARNELHALPDAELSDHQRALKHRKLELDRVARARVLYARRCAEVACKPSQVQ